MCLIMIKFLFSIPLVAVLFNQVSYALTVFLPKENFHDVNIPRTQISNNKSSLLSAIALVNDYLWFFLGFLCFIFFVWNGIRLVMARGDKDVLKKATKAILGSVVGIIICFASYSVVKIVVNMF